MSDDPTQPTFPDEQPTQPNSETTRASDDRPSSQDLAVGTVIASYTIGSLLGRGGMGAVYRATQSSPHRDVALKLMRPGLTSNRALRRFELEAELLGRLSHPGIASIYEAGIFTDAHSQHAPFFAMELVDGPTLREFVRDNTLSTNDRLRLFAKVCDAVHHAHAKGVIHRDLKPSNILVTRDPTTNEPTPKILDFGVARVTDADVTSATMQTEVGQIIGTLPYMSPEQVGGDPTDIDTRSDVYALGVVLYEFLAGKLPYDLERAMIAEVARVIREDEPSRLSSIDTKLRGDVETIVAKALEKERERRYQSALDLGSDIRRYLSDEPIAARPPSTWYQLRKFTRRNKPLVAGVALAFVALTTGLAAATYGLIEADQQRQLADERAADALEAQQTAEEALGDADAARAEEAERADELEQVAQFQSDQLAGIDPPSMGLKLREDLLEKFRARDERAGYDEDEITERLAQLDESLNGVDFTGMALETLEENIFERAIEAIDAQFADQPLVQARLLDVIATTTRDLGLLELSEGPQLSALAIRRRVQGVEHPDTVTSMSNMGVLLHSQGKLSDAEPYFRESLEIGRHTFGDNHPQTLTSIANMGTLHYSLGNLTEAEMYWNEVLESRRRVLGDEHPDTLTAKNNMGSLLRAQGKLAEAETFRREVLESRRRVLGNEHPDTLGAITNMGVLLRHQGKLDEAEPYYREALEASRRILGNEHPTTLTSINNIGYLLISQGKLDEAEPFCLQALEGRLRVLGDNHPETLNSIGNMGVLLYSQGKLGEAEPYWRKELQYRRSVLGDEHPDTLNAVHNMGVLLYSQGMLVEAEPYWREHLETNRRLFGDEHSETLGSITNMGVLLRAQGKLTEAGSFFREALETGRRVQGDEHPETLQFIDNMGGLLYTQGNFEEAMRLCREALEGRLRVLSDRHPKTIASLHNIIFLYTSWHEAEPDAGHDIKAAEYQARLDAILAEQEQEPSADP